MSLEKLIEAAKKYTLDEEYIKLSEEKRQQFIQRFPIEALPEKMNKYHLPHLV